MTRFLLVGAGRIGKIHAENIVRSGRGILASQTPGGDPVKTTLSIALALVLATTAHAAVQTKELEYDSGGTKLTGFLAWDDSVKKAPGLLVIHEWWGHNEHARNQAKRFAAKGYVALAVDMYGKGKVATHPKDAQAFMEAAMGNQAELKARISGEVRFDRTARMLYSTDASNYQIEPVGVVIPRSQDDAIAAIELATSHGVPILPRGGGSSLAGQTVGAALVRRRRAVFARAASTFNRGEFHDNATYRKHSERAVAARAAGSLCCAGGG